MYTEMGALLGDVLRQFESGTLEIDCTQMTAQQEGADLPITYSGPGLIRQTPDRKLEFRLFCTSISNEPTHESLSFPDGGLTPGRIVAPHHYYSLAATDLSHREWLSGRVQIDRQSGNGLVLSGPLQQITLREKALQPDGFVSLSIAADHEFPWNLLTHSVTTIGEQKAESYKRNVAQFTACGCRVMIRQDDARLRITLESEGGALPEHVETRLIEALQFIVGRSLWWSVMTKVVAGIEITCLRSELGDNRHRLDQPINFQMQPLNPAVWQLCERYLAHIWQYQSSKFHPLSAWLHYVRHASTGSIFAKGLALGVAIEGLLEAEFSQIAQSSPDFPAQLAAARSFFSRWEGDGGLKSRIDSAIGAMQGTRAKDRLKALRNQGVLTAKQLKVWDRLRNSAAHARPPDDDELQEWVDLCFTAEVMMYRLIFAAIGYTGEYTDYSAHGWPIAIFSSTALNIRLGAPAPHDMIAKRAYEIWETNLGLANDSLRNWLVAESQLRAEMNDSAGT